MTLESLEVSSTLPVLLLNPEGVSNLRGRTCWTWVFSVIAIVISGLFGLVTGLVSKSPARGFGGALALMTCFLAFRVVHTFVSKRQEDGKPLSEALAIQFFLRGAVVSIVIAMVLEATELSALRPRKVEFKDIPIALIVGFAEEVAKLLAVLLGLCLVASDLPTLVVPDPTRVCCMCLPIGPCVRAWCVLVESPRALAMAGIAAGYGFMTSENMEYFLMIFTTADLPSCIATVVLRIALNLHPLLTGLAAARLARFVWSNGSTPRTVSIGKIARAIYPSVLIHALFDFGLMFTATNPTLVSLDSMFVLTSVSLIPTSIWMLVKTYRALPCVGSVATVGIPV